MKRALLGAFAGALLACTGPLPSEPASPGDVEAHVRTLASPKLGGRLTGTEGERQAAAYLVGQLEELGARPLPGRELAIPFEFAAGTRDAGSRLSLEREGQRVSWEAAGDVRALSFSSTASVTAPVVFAGYGLVVPDAEGHGYDSYAGLDVKGKVVAVLRYFPEDAESEQRGVLARYAGLRYKALAARERGAVALLVVTGPRSPNAGETVPPGLDPAVSGSGIAAASVGGAAAEALFAGLRRGSLEEIQRSFDDGNPHARGFELAGREVSLAVRVERERRTGTNVVGVLPGSAPDGRAVLVGAHYDHLGDGSHGSSLARRGEKGRTHPGADDNASGAAAVLAIGAALVRERPRRDVVLAFWSGEELGVLGSTDFLEREILPPTALAAVLNFDMVGRAESNRLTLHGVGSSPVWKELIERANAPVAFDLRLHEDPHVPTDSLVFDAARVPTLNFFTGVHADYHRPSDTPDRLDYAALGRVATLGARVTRELADGEEPVAFVEVKGSSGSAFGSVSLRTYTGTVPDYSAEAEGLALADVVEGGPAQRAGLRGGDVIVRFGSQQIANIYDYTYALDAAVIGEPLEVIYLRGGERRSVTLVPEARK